MKPLYVHNNIKALLSRQSLEIDNITSIMNTYSNKLCKPAILSWVSVVPNCPRVCFQVCSPFDYYKGDKRQKKQNMDIIQKSSIETANYF